MCVGVGLQAMEVYLTKTIKGLRDALDKALLPSKAKKGKAPPTHPQEVLPHVLLLMHCVYCHMGRVCCT